MTDESLVGHETGARSLADVCRALVDRAEGLGDIITHGNDENNTLSFNSSERILTLAKTVEGGVQEKYVLMDQEGHIELEKSIETLDGVRLGARVVRKDSNTGLWGEVSEHSRNAGEVSHDELHPSEISSLAAHILKDLSAELDKRDVASIEARDARVDRILNSIVGVPPEEE